MIFLVGCVWPSCMLCCCRTVNVDKVITAAQSNTLKCNQCHTLELQIRHRAALAINALPRSEVLSQIRVSAISAVLPPDRLQNWGAGNDAPSLESNSVSNGK